MLIFYGEQILSTVCPQIHKLNEVCQASRAFWSARLSCSRRSFRKQKMPILILIILYHIQAGAMFTQQLFEWIYNHQLKNFRLGRVLVLKIKKVKKYKNSIDLRINNSPLCEFLHSGPSVEFRKVWHEKGRFQISLLCLQYLVCGVSRTCQ